MITTMSITDILALPSVDSLRLFAETVADLMPRKTDELKEGCNYSPYEYDLVREAMRSNGINEVPIHVAQGKFLASCYGAVCQEKYAERLVMGNGHHRVALALQLGHEYMQVTDDIYESGWEDSNEWLEDYE